MARSLANGLLIAVSGAALAALLIGEARAPLRRRTRRALPRNLRNAAMGAMCAAFVQAAEVPLAEAVARKNGQKRRGLARLVPAPLRGAIAFAAMDYGLYLWHIATHRNRFLWRFHRVHHVDPDLDASTGVRFHAVDMLVSIPWRLVQVRASGISPGGLRLWRRFFSASILFHHSNLALPDGWDRKLSFLLTTPKLHGIHHSIVPDERDTNWSSGLSIWDRLHRTFRQEVPQEVLTIGIADLRAEEDVALIPALTAPFKHLPEDASA
jgi:sterol desaturase/sphingolipid hydroxylase (fatty acid hydroxylase superfamily)